MSEEWSFSSPRRVTTTALVNLVTAGAALFVASVCLIFFQFLSLRNALIEDVSVQAMIISHNSAAALLFHDKRAGEETLAALRSSPSIQAAGIFTDKRVPLALQQRPNEAQIGLPSDALIAAGYSFSLNSLEVAQRINQDSQSIGFVVIRAGMQQLYARLLSYAGLILAVALGSLAAAYLLLSRMRRAVLNSEAHLDYLAHIDSLTNLPNRRAFNERLSYAISGAHQFGGAVGLLLLDLDNFKVVNDTLGHNNGDKLLKLVTQRLIERLRTTDTICRIGGDEFVIILASRNAAEEIVSVAEKVTAALAPPFLLGIHEIYVTASVGISVYPQDAEDVETLMRNADTAMYQAKSRGKNAYQKFHPEMDQRAQKRLSLEAKLRKALERGELLLHYQPQVDLSTGKIVGVEALARWHHPELGFVSPVEFIPVAEESGLIVSLGRWVLRTACQQAATWHDAGLLGDMHMAVNLSVRQTKDGGLMSDILTILRETNLSPNQLELEITESVLMENVHANVELMKRLQMEGIHLSIDDFGTGYSSMAYLKRFPIDKLKIDRSFVRDIPGDGDDEAIATAIIAMAHGLGMSVVAEGIETEEQLQFLRSAGCDIMQGYYFARPMSAGQLTALLLERRAAMAAA